MGKAKNTLLFLALGYGLPLCLRPELLLHYKILFLMAAAVAVFLTQPGFEMKDAEQSRDKDRNSVLLILGLSVLAVAAPIVEWGYFHPERHHAHWVGLGAVLVLAGTGLRIWAIQVLGRHFTATVQIQTAHQLVQHGPFALVRHPSYLGVLLTAMGSAILLEAWWGLLIGLIALLYAYSVRIRAEELALAEALGPQYVDYQQRTKRLIPGIW